MLIEGSLTASTDFWLQMNLENVAKSIEHDYIRIIKVSAFKQWELAQLARHEVRSKH